MRAQVCGLQGVLRAVQAVWVLLCWLPPELSQHRWLLEREVEVVLLLLLLAEAVVPLCALLLGMRRGSSLWLIGLVLWLATNLRKTVSFILRAFARTA